MKVAVCLYGFLRSNQITAHSLVEHLVKPLNADLFICCPSYFYPPTHLDAFISKSEEDVQVVEGKFFHEAYGEFLKGFSILPYEPEMFHNAVKAFDLPEENRIPQKVFRILSMFYHIKNALQLRQQYEAREGFKYEMVILTRGDLEFFPNPPCDIRNFQVDLNQVWTTNHHISPVHGFPPHRFNDLFVFSKPENMDLLGQVYNQIPAYHQEGILINQETLCGVQFLKHQVPFGIYNLVNHRIIR